MSTKVNDCKLIVFAKHNEDHRGCLSVIENSEQIPFDIKRVYYLYDIPSGESRAGHAHRELQQLIIALSGSFDIIINDSDTSKTVTLNRPNVGLLLQPGIWRDINNFSSGAVCLVLASEKYNEKDYIRDFHEFELWKK
ncbi:dTDP-6-deoxy-3,4-keto-hexulose isomerase [Bacteroidia bacterium]|nr:dTDP-6-deoxy-3,4-keto-hexulose isomerase [Bacteroidia bacterium]